MNPFLLIVAAALTVTTTVEGPWGRLELVPIRIQLPETMVPDRPLPAQPWVFGSSRADARRTLVAAGIDESLSDELMTTYQDPRGVLLPSPGTSRRIPREARGRLYEILRRIPENSAQQSPYKFFRERFDRRFGVLRRETRELVEEFLYERESAPESVLLADLPALTRLVEDPVERVKLVRAISAQDSLLLRMRIDASTDAAALADYWGRGGRRRDLEILIDSLKEFEGGYDLDAIYLLPAFARSFLFTYPSPERAEVRDCFWTALNFFLPSPDDSLDGPGLRRMLDESYEPVQGEPLLGDILVLWRPGGEAEHAAVYIASDIYFTKNGGRLAIPWLLMPLPELLDRYDDTVRSPFVHFRRKGLD